MARLMLVILCGFFALGSTAFAQEEENVCTEAGLSGAPWALCNAYCEKLDCDSDTPKGNAFVCENVLAKFEERAGVGAVPPCLIAQVCPVSGVWSGTFIQPELDPFPLTYPIIVEIPGVECAPGDIITLDVEITVSYPGDDACEGTWDVDSSDAFSFDVTETLSGDCFSNCQYTLAYNGLDTLSLSAGLPNCSDDADQWSAQLQRTP